MYIKRLLILYYYLLVSSLYAQPRMEQVVVLGSGPAGISAAIYTSRANLSTLVLEAEPPDEIALSYIIDNYPGFPEGISGYQLQQKMRDQAIRFGARIEECTVVGVDLSQRPYVIYIEDEDPILTDTVIIALGTSARTLGLESERVLTGYGVSICSICDAALYKDKEVVVVGNGDTALEEALALAGYAAKVTIIPQSNSLKASKKLQSKVQANSKIGFVWDCQIIDITDPKKKSVTGVLLKDLSSAEKRFYPCDGVFVAVGYKPNTELFKGQLALDQAGFIITKAHTMQTSLPGVFAAGTVTDSHYKQAVTGAGMGAMAGIDAFQFIKGLKEEVTP
jgi:thioredoxin reductase (NADPH)